MFNMDQGSLKAMALVAAIQKIIEFVGEVVDYGFTKAWAYIRTSIFSEIPNMHLESDPSVGQKISYKKGVTRETKKPYTFTHTLREKDEYITAMCCLPLNETLQCPEMNVIEGGINHNYVKISLEPVWRGKWGCFILMCNTK